MRVSRERVRSIKLSRLKRHLFNLLAGLSLAISLATAVFWARSYYVGENWTFLVRDRGKSGRYREVLHVLTHCGQFNLSWGGALVESANGHTFALVVLYGQRQPPTQAWFFGSYENHQDQFTIFMHRHGFFLDGDSNLQTPGWAVCFFSGILAILLTKPWLRVLKFRRRNLGRCVACGYDLRATPDRCPECGTAPSGHELASG